MITSPKTYTKKKKQNINRQLEPQDKWQNKAIQAKSHKEAYTYTHKKRKRKEKIYMYIK